MKNKFSAFLLLVLLVLPASTNANTANIILTPNITSLTTGQNLTVSISASSSTSSIDVIQFSGISYNAAVLELQSFSKAGNCAFVFPPTNYLYSCGLSPAVGSGSVNIATVTFKTKQSGSTAISLNNLKAISSGVDVNVTGGLVNISVSAPYIPPQKPGLVFVSSSTHPDENGWYANGNLSLSWTKAPGVSDFSFVLDNKESTIPPDNSLGSGNTKSYSDLDEGTYYFHIKAKNDQGWGGVRHFRVNIDKTKPYDLSLTFEVGGTSIEPKTYAKFEAKDNLSGIERYEISIGGRDFIEAKSPYEMPLIEDKKSQSVIIRAFDRAGNSIEKEGSFDQKSAVVPKPEIDEISSSIKIITKDNLLKREYYIKGRASLGTLVSVYLNDKFLGEVEVGDKGEWIFFFQKPESDNNFTYAISSFGDLKSEKSEIIFFSFDSTGALVLGDRSRTAPILYLAFLLFVLAGYGAMRNKKFKKFIHLDSFHLNH
jgi:hypothetical protein